MTDVGQITRLEAHLVKLASASEGMSERQKAEVLAHLQKAFDTWRAALARKEPPPSQKKDEPMDLC